MTALPSPPPLLKPAPVSQGAGISVISPASFANPDRVQRGVEDTCALGFAPQLGAHTQTRGPLFFAGTPGQRLADLHAAFADPDTSVVALRARRIRLQLPSSADSTSDLIRKHPKPFFAYSDLTGIQLSPARSTRPARLSRPHGRCRFLSRRRRAHAQLSGSAGRQPIYFRRLRRSAHIEARHGARHALRRLPKHSGFAPRHALGAATEGKLLFLEDTGVKPYQVDRMLWQLRQAGKLDGVRGIIFGEMLDCVSPGAPANLLEEVILSALGDLDVPIAIGLRSGHVSRQNVTLIFGVEAELQCRRQPTITHP